MKANAKTTTANNAPKVDIKEKVMSLILEACEKEGKLPWDKGVLNDTFFPFNPQTKTNYRGFNRMLLYWLGMGNGNTTLEFLTFKGVQALGGKVNKGAKALPVVYWNFNKWNKVENRPAQDGDNPKDIKTIPFVRAYNVFRITDTTVAPTRKLLEKKENASNETIDAFVEKFAEATKVVIDYHKGGTAAYGHVTHKIRIAGRTFYKSSEEFYSTLFHELVHSTAKKMERKVDYDSWGDHTYSKEEIVAETGAMFLCHYFGIEKTTQRNSQAYLQSWSAKLRKNPLWLISGANAAEKAVNYMLTTAGFAPMSGSVEEENEAKEA